MIDPYPEELLAEIPKDSGDPLVNAITRLAQAVEANTAALTRQNAPGAALPAYVPTSATNPPLAPLPPVQTVQARPACPFHGIEKVAPSTNGKGGFYCQAKPGIGMPNTNPKGYCTWHT